MKNSQDAADPVRPRRGREMTRLETFTDAAFAFAAAMLAISIDEIPGTYDELIRALKDVPAFAASFGILLLYWRAHQNWSQRYGLEDLPSVLLTFTLILTVMVYVYPLKIMFGAAFQFISDGWLPSAFVLESVQQFRAMVALFGVGFFVLSALIAALYYVAWTRRRRLDMGAAERLDTAIESAAWFIVAAFGLVSLTLGWTLPADLVFLAPWVYMLLVLVGPAMGLVQRRLIDRHMARTG